MYCTGCGATVEGKRFCPSCGKPVSAPPPPPPRRRSPPPPPPPPPPSKSADPRGKLIVEASAPVPPWNPTVGYGFGAAIGVLLVFLGMAMQHRWNGGISFAVGSIFFCLAALAGVLLVRIPRRIRLYEHGLEADVPRSSRRHWLPWAALRKYEWEGDVLRYTWDPNGVMVLANGRVRGRSPRAPFPNAVRVPQQQQSHVSDLLRRQAPPPKR